MENFTLTSPSESKGFTGKNYREILSCEIGSEESKYIREIGLSCDGVIGWRLSGYGTVLEIPESGNNHVLDMPEGAEWDGYFKIEAKAGHGRVFPYAWIKGEVAIDA